MGLKRSGQGAINQAEMIFGYLFLSKWNGDEWLWRLVKILVVMIVHKFPKISSAIYGWWVSIHIFWNGLAFRVLDGPPFLFNHITLVHLLFPCSSRRWTHDFVFCYNIYLFWEN